MKIPCIETLPDQPRKRKAGQGLSSGIPPRQRAVQRPDAPQGSTPPLFTGKTTSPASTLPPWISNPARPRHTQSLPARGERPAPRCLHLPASAREENPRAVEKNLRETNSARPTAQAGGRAGSFQAEFLRVSAPSSGQTRHRGARRRFSQAGQPRPRRRCRRGSFSPSCPECCAARRAAGRWYSCSPA